MDNRLPSQNLAALNEDARALVAYLFERWTGWTLTYMVEVRLDDPVANILDGGDGMVAHGGNGSPHYATHLNDQEWAVIHCESPEWLALDKLAMLKRARVVLDDLFKETQPPPDGD